MINKESNMYNNSNIIGNIGEAIAIAEFSKRGIPVSIPFGQNAPYDLIVQINNILYRIQCKTTKIVHNNGIMQFSICRTNGFKSIHTIYSNDEIDFIFLYCVENNFIGLISVAETFGSREISIRTFPATNNQYKKVRFAKDYEFNLQLHRLMHNNRCPIYFYNMH